MKKCGIPKWNYFFIHYVWKNVNSKVKSFFIFYIWKIWNSKVKLFSHTLSMKNLEFQSEIIFSYIIFEKTWNSKVQIFVHTLCMKKCEFQSEIVFSYIMYEKTWIRNVHVLLLVKSPKLQGRGMVVAWSFWVDVSEHLGPRGLLEARRSWQLGRGSWGVLSALTRALEGPYPITTWGRVNLNPCNP